MTTIIIPELAQFKKDPFDWGDWEIRWLHYLAKHSDTIATGSFTILTPNDGALVIGNVLQTSTSQYVWLYTGTLNQEYYVQGIIDTTGGRRWRRTILVKIVSQ